MTKKSILKTYQDESPEREQYTLQLKPKSKKIVQSHTWVYLGLVGNIGYTISVPIAGGAIIGSMIDRKWSTYPKATLACLFIGIVLSIIGFVGIVRKILEKKI